MHKYERGVITPMGLIKINKRWIIWYFLSWNKMSLSILYCLLGSILLSLHEKQLHHVRQKDKVVFVIGWKFIIMNISVYIGVNSGNGNG